MDGIVLTPLKQIYNVKGDIFHIMKKSDDGFYGFAEAYFSTINKNVIKGWKQHTEMTLNLVVVIGEVEFVLYDNISKEFFTVCLSKKNYQRLTVRHGIWMAFRGIDEKNIVLNLANIEHNSDEANNLGLDEIKYEW
ncbi:MAG: dTDP-4-dehydrorhamnose 3,5-epimerase [Sulfurimonas sp.]|nr:MAG: dTDP-4-dehydrorhamnose 3,5-epimerase [Sulfurimonas sp.]